MQSAIVKWSEEVLRLMQKKNKIKEDIASKPGARRARQVASNFFLPTPCIPCTHAFTPDLHESPRRVALPSPSCAITCPNPDLRARNLALRSKLRVDMDGVRDLMRKKQMELRRFEHQLLSLEDHPYMLKRNLIMPLDKLDQDLRDELPFESFKLWSGRDDKRREVAKLKALIRFVPEDDKDKPDEELATIYKARTARTPTP